MDIHKPKPVHGWKERLGEIGGVVIGISIALSAEAGLEALHWREQVKDAHEVLTADMARMIGQAAEREGFSACIGQHLDRWAEMVEQGASTGRLPPQGAMHRAPRRLWRLYSWDALTAAGVGPHLNRAEMLRLSVIDHALTLAGEAEADEDVQWTRLYTMVGPGRAVDAAELTELRYAVSRARADAKSLRLAASDITGLIESTKLLSTKAEKGVRDERTAFAKTHCVPDEPIPAHYGDGPPAGMPLDKPLGR